MVQAISKKYGNNVFNPNPHSIRLGFETIRKQLVETTKDERFMQIHIHTFRLYFATNLFRKTQNIKRVQIDLGHKNSSNTNRYTEMVVFREEEYYSTTAKTVQEVCKLVEDCWSFFAEIDGIKVFRKPK